MTADQLRAAFTAKLKESGLTKADADSLGFRPYTQEGARKKFPGLPSALVRDGFVLPYRTLDGNQNGFSRWRNLEQTVRGFAALTDAEPPPKYLQAIDSSAEIFLPFLPNLPSDWWASIAKDTNKLLLTTEGELKACCAVKHGLPTFAIGGVEMFSAKKQNLWMLKSFDWFKWEGREVYVILDSDATSKPEVRDAGGRYCARLAERGAHVYLFTLPAMPGLKKTGLDDYLEHEDGGVEKLVELLKATEESQQSIELWRMNDLCIYVREVSQVYVPSEDLFLRPQEFITNYRTRTYTVTREHSKKITMEKKIVPNEWLGWEGRRECGRVTFDPTLPPLAISPADEFNMFSGLPTEPKKGDLQPWKDLMEWMFAEEPELQKWFTSWAAYPLQRIKVGQEPKMHTCVALISHQQGSGKGLVGTTLGKLYGSAYADITSRVLGGQFNEWATNRLFVVGNEITDKASADVADELKGLITESTFSLNRKYVKQIVQPNHMNFLFTSNHVDAFFVSFADRRFFIHNAPPQKLLEGWGREKLDAYVAWRDSVEGRAALLYHLLEWKIPSSWDHRSPPDTAAKYTLQAGSANLAETWLRDIASAPEMLGDLKDRRLWTADELLAQFQRKTNNAFYSAKGFGKALADAQWHHVLRGRQVRGLYSHKEASKLADGKFVKEHKKEPLPKKPLWMAPYFANQKPNTELEAREQFNAERERERDAKIAGAKTKP
jgi:hypothetical protein